METQQQVGSPHRLEDPLDVTHGITHLAELQQCHLSAGMRSQDEMHMEGNDERQGRRSPDQRNYTLKMHRVDVNIGVNVSGTQRRSFIEATMEKQDIIDDLDIRSLGAFQTGVSEDL